MKYIRKIYYGIRRLLRPTKYYSDDFTQWLAFYNAGMMDSGNPYLFNWAIQNLPSNKPIVEIGAFCGLSTNMITHFQRMHSKTNPFYSVDAFDYDPQRSMLKISGVDLTFFDFNEKVLNQYKANVELFSRQNMPIAIKAFSQEFFDTWKTKTTVEDLFGKRITLGGEISFAYIDGDHSYEGAKFDFENFDKILEVGGFVLFDDSADESNWPVKKVIREVKRSNRYEVVFKNPNYLFRKLR